MVDGGYWEVACEGGGRVDVQLGSLQVGLRVECLQSVNACIHSVMALVLAVSGMLPCILTLCSCLYGEKRCVFDALRVS